MVLVPFVFLFKFFSLTTFLKIFIFITLYFDPEALLLNWLHVQSFSAGDYIFGYVKLLSTGNDVTN